ncbi:hypothetical protein F5Y06DRAFT_78483 [Hypoxylon sp. FL0890]|nr:hypothetical protein F5Y06DRAFT_78483 [Hypoxylon sp. FL0890]
MDTILNLLNQLSSLPLDEQEAFLDGPALTPPPNVVPNLDNPPNNNALALVMVTIHLAIVTIAMVLRAYAKIFVARRVFLEDIVSFIGYPVIVLSFCWCYRLSYKPGFFVRQWDIRLRDLPEIFYVVKLEISSYAIAIMTLKVAILLEWARVFSPHRTQKSFYWTCHILLWINVLFYFTVIVLENVACPPQKEPLDSTVQSVCIRQTVTADITSAALNLVSHILILVLPQRVIWKLNMTTQKKIGVSLVFAIGIMAVALGIWRLAVTVLYFTTTDMIFTVYEVSLLRSAELTFVVLVFCIPAFPKIFRERVPLSEAIASFRSWLSLVTGRSKVDGDSTQTSPRDNPATSDGTYRTAGETGILPLKNTENWNRQDFRSAEQLQKDYNEISPGADIRASTNLATHSEIDLEGCSGNMPMNGGEFKIPSTQPHL